MKLPKVIAWFACPIMFRMSRCNGIDGLYKHGDGSPCLRRKALSEKMIDGDARLFHFRSSRNAEDAAVSKEAKSAVFFISMRADGSSAPTMLPAR